MKYGTHLGDGLIFIPIVLISLIYRYRFAITLALTGILLSVLTNILKQVIYTDTERPKRFFDGVADLHFVEGVEMHGLNSFPSGHTATAAALAMLVSLEWRRAGVVIPAVLYALFIGFSRIYLAQHFLRDVVFGYLEGISVAVLGYLLARKFVKPYSWSESSLLRL
jgi:membrane-associated phospholipid phosphatase